MLRHLRVSNFAILSDVELELGAGMNALTGETGAGKSLIVEAVNLLRGGRASADIPRAGTEEAVVEAVVEVPADLRARVSGVLEASGLPSALGAATGAAAGQGGEGDAGEVFIRRVIQRGGRSRTYVNGALTTAARLAELGGLLVDLSGQHQHQGLVDPARHCGILDAFADSHDIAKAMLAAWQELARVEQAVAELLGDETARDARAEFLRFVVNEVDQAALAAGEDEQLEVERARLGAVVQLQHGARAAEDFLYGGDGSARDRIAAAGRELDRIARFDPSLEGVSRALSEVRTLVDDVASQLRHYADRLEHDPERLAEVEDRLALVKRLLRKHGGSVAEVLAKVEGMRDELSGLEHRDERLAELQKARRQALARAEECAAALTARRTVAARRLEREVGAALGELGMGAARLFVKVERRPLGPTGADQVELLLASNKGEETRPLAKVASGGELSRIMLAMKLVLRRADEVATYVFDEVDSGIGGATASVVARQIHVVAEHRQVLCVTHLPQIAAFAAHHFLVEKHEHEGRTETKVHKLGATARRDELARMLGGHATARARAHATELLEEARAVQQRQASQASAAAATADDKDRSERKPERAARADRIEKPVERGGKPKAAAARRAS
jgi:DNA repair protein RecN (Recombination protein N)